MHKKIWELSTQVENFTPPSEGVIDHHSRAVHHYVIYILVYIFLHTDRVSKQSEVRRWGKGRAEGVAEPGLASVLCKCPNHKLHFTVKQYQHPPCRRPSGPTQSPPPNQKAGWNERLDSHWPRHQVQRSPWLVSGRPHWITTNYRSGGHKSMGINMQSRAKGVYKVSQSEGDAT